MRLSAAVLIFVLTVPFTGSSSSGQTYSIPLDASNTSFVTDFVVGTGVLGAGGCVHPQEGATEFGFAVLDYKVEPILGVATLVPQQVTSGLWRTTYQDAVVAQTKGLVVVSQGTEGSIRTLWACANLFLSSSAHEQHVVAFITRNASWTGGSAFSLTFSGDAPVVFLGNESTNAGRIASIREFQPAAESAVASESDCLVCAVPAEVAAGGSSFGVHASEGLLGSFGYVPVNSPAFVGGVGAYGVVDPQGAVLPGCGSPFLVECETIGTVAWADEFSGGPGDYRFVHAASAGGEPLAVAWVDAKLPAGVADLRAAP